MTAKGLNRQAAKAHKEAEAQKGRVKKVASLGEGMAAKEELIWEKAIQQGNADIARLYAGNVIRKETEHINLLRLSSRIDAVASRVQTAVTMRNVKAGWLYWL